MQTSFGNGIKTYNMERSICDILRDRNNQDAAVVSEEKSIQAEIILRNFMLERLLERISVSPFPDKFILKGGMLVAAMVGIDTRSTMDMDATIRRINLSEETLKGFITL